VEEVEEVAKRGKGIGGPFEKACAQVRKEVGAGIWVELDLSLLLWGQFFSIFQAGFGLFPRLRIA
jgi:hypothetical protein